MSGYQLVLGCAVGWGLHHLGNVLHHGVHLVIQGLLWRSCGWRGDVVWVCEEVVVHVELVEISAV